MKNNKVVYGWFSDGEIFYIGIGSVKRSQSKYMRNSHCLNKRAKAERENCFEIKIFYSGLAWKKACKIECQLIKQYGRKDNGTGILTNMTDGGEGRLNYTTTEKVKQKISKSLQGENNPMYGRTGKSSHRYGITGKEHPNSKRVMTPDGIFESCQEAADFYGKLKQSMSRTISNPRIADYYYTI